MNVYLKAIERYGAGVILDIETRGWSVGMIYSIYIHCGRSNGFDLLNDHLALVGELFEIWLKGEVVMEGFHIGW